MDNNQDENKQIEELKLLVNQSIKKSDEVLEKVNWMKSYLKMQKIIGIAKVILIVIPIIIGLIYLPPILKDYLDQLTSLYK